MLMWSAVEKQQQSLNMKDVIRANTIKELSWLVATLKNKSFVFHKMLNTLIQA